MLCVHIALEWLYFRCNEEEHKFCYERPWTDLVNDVCCLDPNSDLLSEGDCIVGLSSSSTLVERSLVELVYSNIFCMSNKRPPYETPFS